MPRAIPNRYWDPVEGGLFALLIAVCMSLETSAVPIRYTAFGGICLIVALAGVAAYWIRHSSRAHLLLAQVTLIGVVALVLAVAFLGGVPFLYLGPAILAGFALGSVFGLAPFSIIGIIGGIIYVFVFGAGDFILAWISQFKSPSPENVFWGVLLGLTSAFSASVLARQPTPAMFSRLWAYLHVLVATWLIPVLAVFANLHGDWNIGWGLWLSAIVVTAGVIGLQYVFESSFKLSLWVMPRLLDIRTKAAERLIEAEQFEAVLAECGEALATSPGDQHVISRKAYALERLGHTTEAYALVQTVGSYIQHRFVTEYEHPQRTDLALLQLLGRDRFLVNTLAKELDTVPNAIVLQVIAAMVEPSPEKFAGIREGIQALKARPPAAGSLQYNRAPPVPPLDPELIRLLEQEARLPEPVKPPHCKDSTLRNLALLSDSMSDVALRPFVQQVWSGLGNAFAQRLPQILWDQDIVVARRAANLLLQVDDRIIPAYVGNLTSPEFSIRAYAGLVLARVALLAQDSRPRVILPPQATSDDVVAVLMWESNSASAEIPMLTRPDGRRLYVLSVGQRYRVMLKYPTFMATPWHLFLEIPNVRIEPSFSQRLEPGQPPGELIWHLEPGEMLDNRLLLKLIADGREQALLLDCDILVASGELTQGLV